MASPITFGGLASGIDTNSIIDKLMQAERQPIVRLQQEKADAQNKKSLLGDINSRLDSLATATRALELQTGVQGRSVNLASDAPIAATVQGGAPVGSYNITVQQLAQAQRTYSAAFNNADQPLNLTATTLTVQVGAGAAKNVAVTATDTLNDVAQKLNSTGLALSAAVVYDGAKYRIVVNGRNTGQANAITFSEGAASGLKLQDMGATVVAAKDAQVTIDGLTVRSDTNTIANSIPGVSLTVKSLSKKDANNNFIETPLTVQEDPDKLKTGLKAVVDKFNEAMTLVKRQFPDGKTPPKSDTLAGETVMRQLQQSLSGFTITQGGPANNAVASLTEIGLNVDRYGTMTLDENRLAQVMAKDPAAVNNLLTDGQNGVMKKLGATLKTYTDFIDGSLSNKGKALDARIKNIDDEVARLEKAADAYETGLRQQFSAMEQLISSFNNQTSSLNAILNGGGGGK